MSQKVSPIHASMARDHLRLSRECLERAYDLDPTLRPKPTRSIATDSMALDEDKITQLAERAFRKEFNMTRSRTTSRQHALDDDSRDLDGAYKALYQALDHVVGARDGQFDFDSAIYSRHVATANDCLGGSTGKTGDSRTGARDALPRGMRRSADDAGFDANVLFQRAEL
jgi:hypothetical protein